ncbi:hypothetical protein CR513_13147, partial [Mucuna pruriens]
MCIDYSDMNKACPKDSYPVPSIDRLIDEPSGFQVFSLLDTYFVYNQIQMCLPKIASSPKFGLGKWSSPLWLPQGLPLATTHNHASTRSRSSPKNECLPLATLSRARLGKRASRP